MTIETKVHVESTQVEKRDGGAGTHFVTWPLRTGEEAEYSMSY